MSMYNTPQEALTARKRHCCTNCGEFIEPGETYVRWTTFEDSAFTSKMHPDCLQSLENDSESGQFEYMPYSGERPAATPKATP